MRMLIKAFGQSISL